MMRRAGAILVALVAAFARGAEHDPGPRRLPPAGEAIAELVAKLKPDARQAWAAVPTRLAEARRRSDAFPFATDADRVDVEVLLDAVQLAVDGGEWWQPADLGHASWALDEAAQRLDALGRGERPWRTATGLSVHGFRSALDGCVQPYGLWVPETLDSTRPAPLWIWLHGRGEKETNLHFLQQRAHKQPEFRPDEAIVLLPFGRYCNGWKGPGLVDVFEAGRAVGGLRAIDPDRVVLAGFSMGGAGAWQIGARRVGEFCAVHGGAGFVDTRRYTGVDPATLPWYEVRLWATTDVPPVARNLLNVPAIAYSGEVDKQRAASEIMVETLAAEGRVLQHVIGAGMPHKYDAPSRREITAFLGRAVAAGRPRQPASVHLAATTLADARVRWLEALGLGAHFHPARIDATRTARDGATVVTATTANVTALAIHDAAGVSTLRIDGVDLAVPDAAAEPLIAARADLRPDGDWRLVTAADLPPLRKRPGLTGPIDDAFTSAFVVVPPEREGLSPEIDAFARREFEQFRRRWRELFRGRLPVSAAADVTAEMLREKNLVLFGDPQSNPLIARVLPDLPLRWTSDELLIAGQAHAASSHAPVMIFPNPLAPPTATVHGRYVVLNSGITFRDEADASNAWQNPKLPDWAVVAPRMDDRGRHPGGIVAAGFFDERWRIPAAEPSR
jgi:hypothetical protein